MPKKQDCAASAFDQFRNHSRTEAAKVLKKQDCAASAFDSLNHSRVEAAKVLQKQDYVASAFVLLSDYALNGLSF